MYTGVTNPETTFSGLKLRGYVSSFPTDKTIKPDEMPLMVVASKCHLRLKKKSLQKTYLTVALTLVQLNPLVPPRCASMWR